MGRFLVRRILGAAVVMLVASVVIFSIIYFIPGDPVSALAPPNALPEQLEAVRAKYNLDEPVSVQYITWLSRAVRGDMGNSISNGFDVTDLIRLKFGITLQLALAGFLFAVVTAFPLGIAAGLRPRGIAAKILKVYTVGGFAVPNFWTGMLMILLFGVTLGWLPTSGFVSVFDDPVQALRHLLMPAIVLSIATSVIIASFLRGSVESVSRSEYITSATARGIPRSRVVWKHILRNALIPVLTIAMLQLGLMMAGTVITESLFAIPGMGRLILDAINARDYPVLQGALLFIVAIFVVLNLVTDLLYVRIDPRIRLSGRRGS